MGVKHMYKGMRPFGNLCVGDFFCCEKWQGDGIKIFIKIDPVTSKMDYYHINATCIEDGSTWWVDDDECVLKFAGKLEIE